MLIRSPSVATPQQTCKSTIQYPTLQKLIIHSYGHSLVQFDQKAEAKLRLKIDLYIVPTVALLYLFCFIDRANIGNAKLAGLEKDLGLVNYD
jgi:hypothetical protein